MRAKKGFELRKVCGQNMIVAQGKENIDFNNIISMNDSSALLWEEIQGKEFSVGDLAEILMENYQIDDNTPLPKDIAMRDACTVVEQWKEAGIVEE